MERLATLTPTDINNGVLNHMLASAGIPDVQEYVKQFHRETENLVIEDFEQADPHALKADEQIVPPADIHNWLRGYRPRFDDSVQQPTHEHQPVVTPNQSLAPKDLSGWLDGLHPRLDQTVEEAVPAKPSPPPPPKNMSNWLQRIAPVNLSVLASEIPSDELTDLESYKAVTGDVGTWLNDWSRSFALQPPPTSLSTWLEGLIPKDIHESLGKTASPKARLNSYLNAAQEVLSQHGYKVDSGAVPTTAQPPVKAGMFGNVKHMYFLVSTASFSLSLTSRFVFAVENAGQEQRSKDHRRRCADHTARVGPGLSEPVCGTDAVRDGGHESRWLVAIPRLSCSDGDHQTTSRGHGIGESLGF